MAARVYDVNWVYTRKDYAPSLLFREGVTKIRVHDYALQTNGTQLATVVIWEDGVEEALHRGEARVDGNSNLVLRLSSESEVKEQLERVVMTEWWDEASKVWVLVGQTLEGDPDGTGGFGGTGG